MVGQTDRERSEPFGRVRTFPFRLLGSWFCCAGPLQMVKSLNPRLQTWPRWGGTCNNIRSSSNGMLSTLWRQWRRARGEFYYKLQSSPREGATTTVMHVQFPRIPVLNNFCHLLQFNSSCYTETKNKKYKCIWWNPICAPQQTTLVQAPVERHTYFILSLTTIMIMIIIPCAIYK